MKLTIETNDRPHSPRPAYTARADRAYRSMVRAVVTRQRRTIRELEAENRALRAGWPMDARTVSMLRLQIARALRRWGV